MQHTFYYIEVHMYVRGVGKAVWDLTFSALISVKIYPHVTKQPWLISPKGRQINQWLLTLYNRLC